MTQTSAYIPSDVEKKWQEIWEEEGAFRAKTDYTLPKFYGLVEFPYPSGNGLHVGHPRSYTAMDILARKRRLEGYRAGCGFHRKPDIQLLLHRQNVCNRKEGHDPALRTPGGSMQQASQCHHPASGLPGRD